MNGGWHVALLNGGLVGVPDEENTEWDPSASADQREREEENDRTYSAMLNDKNCAACS